VKAQPKDGEANAELIKLCAKYFDLPKSSFKISFGHSSRQKVLEISNVDEGNIVKKLQRDLFHKSD